MVLQQMAVVPQRPEEPGIQGLFQGGVPDVDIRAGREGAGFRAAVGVDMEEAAPGRHAARKKPLPLLILFGPHSCEYILVGRKVAEDHGIPALEGLAKCLAFGFTWWLPIRKAQ